LELLLGLVHFILDFVGLDDTLFGGEGDDILNGGYGNTNFSCGDGIDTIADLSNIQEDIELDSCEVY